MKLTEEQQNEIIETYLKTKSQVETAKITNHSVTTVWRYVNKHGLGCGIGGNQTQRKITDEQLRDACATMSRTEIANAYGIHVATLDKRMAALGISASKSRTDGKSVFSRGSQSGWHYVKTIDDFVKAERTTFDFVAYNSDGRKVKLKCKLCGSETVRDYSTVKKYNTVCKQCKENKRINEWRTQLRDALLRVIESKTPKVCKQCGCTFYSQHPNAKYCSKRCKNRKKQRGNSIRSRCRKYGVFYDSTVKPEVVIERDIGICQICGKVCNRDDRRWGAFGPDFPTVDHIVPLAKGGTHTWGNVQCVCAICNSYKRDVCA